jgi:hypothetical protein
MDISVRQCTKEEAVDWLNEPSILKLLPGRFTSLSDEFTTLVMDDKLLVVVKPHDDGLEVHVACRFRDRAAVKETMRNGIKWLESRGFTTLWTTAPDSRKGLTNLLGFLGFQKVKERWVYGI